MKVIVEWGKPKSACSNRPCGVSGQFIVQNNAQAASLASQLFWTLTEGKESLNSSVQVSLQEPRKVVWSATWDAWVAVSLLDGVSRGAYSAVADKDAAKHLQESKASQEGVQEIWYFQQVALGIPEFFVVPKRFFDEHEFRDPSVYDTDAGLLQMPLPAGFQVMLDWLEFKGDAEVGRQKLLAAGFIEHNLG